MSTTFTLKIDYIKKIINYVNSLQISKNENEDLNKIRVSVKNNKLLVWLYSRYNTLEFEVSLEEQVDDFILFVDSESLIKAFSNIKIDALFEVKLDTKEILIKHGRSKASLRFWRLEDIKNDYYAPIQIKDYKEFTLNATELQQVIKEANVFVPKLCDMLVLTNMFFDFKDKLNIVGTNKFYLYKNSLDYECKEEVNFLLHPRNLSPIYHLLDEDTITLKVSDDFLLLENSTTKILSKLSEGKFPNYEMILNMDFDYKIKVSVKDLKEIISQGVSISDDLVNRPVFWDIDINQKILFSKAEDNLKQIIESELDFEIIDNPGNKDFSKIKINGKQVLDYLQVAKEEEIIISVKEGKPIIFRGENNLNKVCLIQILKN
jgi:DNA polymerase-3 subunit beta